MAALASHHASCQPRAEETQPNENVLTVCGAARNISLVAKYAVKTPLIFFFIILLSGYLSNRYGSAVFLEVDDGDGDLYNASLVLEGQQVLDVDKQEGIHVGGSPYFQDERVLKIKSDYFDGKNF